MDLFGKKKIAHLEAENAQLRQWLDRFKGMEAIDVAKHVEQLRSELTALHDQQRTVQMELDTARARIVETDEIALLQEVGIYRYRHPLDDAVAYESKLKETKDAIKALSKAGAVHAASEWTVNNSKREGAKMIRDLSKLMLRAYNSEADNVVRTLRPHALESAKARLEKARDTIAKLGKVLQIRISDEYHRWRVYELELTADYLVKVEEEKERLKEERERQREEEKARREMEAEKNRLEKEKSHYLATLKRLQEQGDADAAAQMQDRVEQIESAIQGILNREANIRAGYVYVISNFGSFGEHVVKIGLTRRLEPMDRIRELGDASVPFNFDVHALIFSDDAVGLETRLHQHFADKRVNLVNMRREYFYVTPHEVKEVLEKVGGQQLLEFREVPEATEWRASGGPQRTSPHLNVSSETSRT